MKAKALAAACLLSGCLLPFYLDRDDPRAFLQCDPGGIPPGEFSAALVAFCFLDADGDGDGDAFCVHADFAPSPPRYTPRLWVNDGTGAFSEEPGRMFAVRQGRGAGGRPPSPRGARSTPGGRRVKGRVHRMTQGARFQGG